MLLQWLGEKGSTLGIALFCHMLHPVSHFLVSHYSALMMKLKTIKGNL